MFGSGINHPRDFENLEIALEQFIPNCPPKHVITNVNVFIKFLLNQNFKKFKIQTTHRFSKYLYGKFLCRIVKTTH